MPYTKTIKRVIVEPSARSHPLTSKILRRIRERAPQIHPVSPSRHHEGAGGDDLDKETLRLVTFPGEMLKPCPGTTHYICCGYWILHGGTNCPLDCSYCILQTYFNQPSLRIFVNLGEQLKSIYDIITAHPERIFRIGTGEFADSLALDSLVGWTDLFLPVFSGLKNAVLELKTKTDDIEGLLASPFRDRIIVSWSLNSPDISTREEHRAPSLRKRLEAARRCQEEGYVLGFHFDPLVDHPNWRENYRRTLDLLDAYIDPRAVIWISMGTMRYMPALKPIIRRRHPGSHILDGEFVPGLDGKMRYFKPIRIEMYHFMKEWLDSWHRDLGVYLCMESNEVWEKGLGWSVGTSEGLSRYLDGRVLQLFGPPPHPEYRPGPEGE